MPDDEPTSSTYAVGDPEDGFQVSSTFAPFTAAANPVGGPGGPPQPPTLTMISFDGRLRSEKFGGPDRTRTK